MGVANDTSTAYRSPTHFMQKQDELHEWTDEALFERARTGNPLCFAELIRRQRRRCLAVAFRILGNREDAADVFQNSCCIAFIKFAQCQSGSGFSGWLARIVTNQAISLLREQKKWNTGDSRGVDDEVDLVQRDLTGTGGSPEDQLGSVQLSGILHNEISRTPEHLRTVLVLRDIRQLSHIEIAAQLQIPVPVAKARLSRARRHLRVRLERHLGRMGPATLISETSHILRSLQCRVSTSMSAGS